MISFFVYLFLIGMAFLFLRASKHPIKYAFISSATGIFSFAAGKVVLLFLGIPLYANALNLVVALTLGLPGTILLCVLRYLTY